MIERFRQRAIKMARWGLLRNQLSTFVDKASDQVTREGGLLKPQVSPARHFNGSYLVLAGFFILSSAARAVDHNNIDAGRPLDFDDAEAIAYRERALEGGVAFGVNGSGRANLGGTLEYLNGFAPNTHFSIGIDPQYGRSVGNRVGNQLNRVVNQSNGVVNQSNGVVNQSNGVVNQLTGVGNQLTGVGNQSNLGGNRLNFNGGDLSLTVLHNFNREYKNVPALSARVDTFLPTGRGSNGIDFRLRAIASRQFQQYARLHLNLDFGINNGAQIGARKYLPGVIVGYSRPLGYPTSFNRTLLAQVGLRANPQRGQSAIFNLGAGLRQQVTVDSVFDIGLSSDLSGGRNRSALRIIAGYSKRF